jgi:outer membrane protein assembly factor BamB/predicted phosphodiesterase
MKLFSKIFLALLLFLQTPLLPQVDTIRFAWLSDTHIGNPTAAEDLRNSVNDINSLYGIDFTILSGDITEIGSNEELKLAKQILDSLNSPYYIVPGNHDCKWSESGATFFQKLWGDDRFVFNFDDYLFIGLHQGPRMRMGDGHWAPEDLRWLDSVLQNISKQKRIFFVTHYPIDEGIDNWYEVLDRMKNYNTQAFLFGHGHRNNTYKFEGIPGVMGRSNLRAGNPVGGYTLAEIAGDTIKFYEKNHLTDEKNYWHSVALGERDFELSVQTNRPDFSINESYPHVKEKWIFPKDAVHNSGYTNGSSPAVWKNIVFTADASGNLYGISLEDGNVLSSFNTGGPVYSSPAVKDNYVVFGSADSNIYCINAETGLLNWKVKTGAEVLGSPSIDNNIVYIGGSDRKFRAIDLTSGNVLWVFDKLNGFIESKPLVYKDKIIFGVWDTYLYCLDKTTGELLWRWKGDTEGLLYSPAACWPVASNEIVFIAAPDRKLTAINVNTGKQLWRTGKYQVRESIGISEDGSKIFVRTMRDSIIALPVRGTEPEPLWITNAEFGYDINSAQLVEKNGVLFYGTKNGLLLALDSSDGKILWKYKIGVTVINTVTPLDSKRVLLNDLDGKTTLIEVN